MLHLFIFLNICVFVCSVAHYHYRFLHYIRLVYDILHYFHIFAMYGLFVTVFLSFLI